MRLEIRVRDRLESNSWSCAGIAGGQEWFGYPLACGGWFVSMLRLVWVDGALGNVGIWRGGVANVSSAIRGIFFLPPLSLMTSISPLAAMRRRRWSSMPEYSAASVKESKRGQWRWVGVRGVNLDLQRFCLVTGGHILSRVCRGRLMCRTCAVRSERQRV